MNMLAQCVHFKFETIVILNYSHFIIFLSITHPKTSLHRDKHDIQPLNILGQKVLSGSAQKSNSCRMPAGHIMVSPSKLKNHLIY